MLKVDETGAIRGVGPQDPLGPLGVAHEALDGFEGVARQVGGTGGGDPYRMHGGGSGGGAPALNRRRPARPR